MKEQQDMPDTNIKEPLKNEAPAQPEEAEKARLEAEKSLFDAIKARAEAKRSADLAVAQARIGSIAESKSNIEGSVTVKDNAGKGEATLLASKAIGSAAERIAVALCDVVNGKRIVLMKGAEAPQFANYRQFLLRQGLVEEIFNQADTEAQRLAKEAQELADKGKPPPAETVMAWSATLPPLTAAGVFIDAAANLASYLRSDYEIAGIDLTADAEQLTEQLINAVANRLLGLQANVMVTLPGRRIPQASDFSDTISQLANRTREAEAKATELSKKAEEAKVTGVAERYRQAEALLRDAIKGAADFVDSLGILDSKGVIMMTKVVQEKIVCDELGKDALALVLDVCAPVGGYYTKRTLWNSLGFGGMPFFTMGGAIVTYSLVDKAGTLAASGLIPVHGGYARIDEVPELMTASSS
jgi:hypothetical protein